MVCNDSFDIKLKRTTAAKSHGLSKNMRKIRDKNSMSKFVNENRLYDFLITYRVRHYSIDKFSLSFENIRLINMKINLRVVYKILNSIFLYDSWDEMRQLDFTNGYGGGVMGVISS